MQIDTVAMVQGIHDALAEKKISEEFKRKLVKAIYANSKPGPVRRLEISMRKLLRVLDEVEEPNDSWNQWAQVWSRLGPSIASALGVANCYPREGRKGE